MYREQYWEANHDCEYPESYLSLHASGAEAFSQFCSPVLLLYSSAAGIHIGFAIVQTIGEIVKSYEVQSLPGTRNG